MLSQDLFPCREDGKIVLPPLLLLSPAHRELSSKKCSCDHYLAIREHEQRETPSGPEVDVRVASTIERRPFELPLKETTTGIYSAADEGSQETSNIKNRAFGKYYSFRPPIYKAPEAPPQTSSSSVKPPPQIRWKTKKKATRYRKILPEKGSDSSDTHPLQFLQYKGE